MLRVVGFFAGAVVVTGVFLVLMLVLAHYNRVTPELSTSFECGFIPFEKTVPFSLRFYLLTILFLVFDVEIALLLPLFLGGVSLVGLVFFFVLAVGLLYE